MVNRSDMARFLPGEPCIESMAGCACGFWGFDDDSRVEGVRAETEVR